MDFIGLCQRTWKECALSGAGPSSVNSTNVMHQQVIGWVSGAWSDIQASQVDWNFLTRISGDQSGVARFMAGQQIYTAADLKMTDFSRLRMAWFKRDGKWIPLKVLHEAPDSLDFLNPGEGYPRRILQAEDNRMWIDNVPDKNIDARFKFVRTHQILEENSDKPIMPAQYHLAIVWKAVEQYALYDEDQGMLQRAVSKFEQIERLLEFNELPDWGFDTAELVTHARF